MSFEKSGGVVLDFGGKSDRSKKDVFEFGKKRITVDFSGGNDLVGVGKGKKKVGADTGGGGRRRTADLILGGILGKEKSVVEVG